jgi:hypothetical protein
MRIVFIGLLIILTFNSFVGVAHAEKGVVVHYPSGCDYYIVQYNKGYAVLEWYGGSDPSQGDTLVGNFGGYGMKTISNLSRNSETRVWVEDYSLSKSSAVEKYFEKCS